MLGSGFGKLRGLCAVPGGRTANGAPPGLLLDGQVQHIPSVGAMPPQNALLLSRWCEPVLGHESKLLSATDILEGVERRFLSDLKMEDLTPQIQ
jgi:hypothetical protein